MLPLKKQRRNEEIMKNFKSKFLLFSVTGILSIMALAGCQKKEEKGLTELTLNEVEIGRAHV